MLYTEWRQVAWLREVELEEAEEHLLEAIRIAMDQLGEKHPSIYVYQVRDL